MVKVTCRVVGAAVNGGKKVEVASTDLKHTLIGVRAMIARESENRTVDMKMSSYSGKGLSHTRHVEG